MEKINRLIIAAVQLELQVHKNKNPQFNSVNDFIEDYNDKNPQYSVTEVVNGFYDSENEDLLSFCKSLSENIGKVGNFYEEDEENIFIKQEMDDIINDLIEKGWSEEICENDPVPYLAVNLMCELNTPDIILPIIIDLVQETIEPPIVIFSL